jgi:hypothetical protein
MHAHEMHVTKEAVYLAMFEIHFVLYLSLSLTKAVRFPASVASGPDSQELFSSLWLEKSHSRHCLIEKLRGFKVYSMHAGSICSWSQSTSQELFKSPA